MNTNCCKDIGIGCSQYYCHCSASGKPSNINTMDIYCPPRDILPDCLDNSGNNSWLSIATYLIRRLEPIPAQILIIAIRLLWIYHDEFILISQLIHPCAKREFSSRLCTSMQHHYKGYSYPNMIVFRSIYKIRVTTCRAIICKLLPQRAISTRPCRRLYQETT